MAVSDLMSSPHSRFAKTQQELVEANMKSPLTKEEMDHPLCEAGFVAGEPLERMTPENFYQAVSTIMKARPSARFWDVVPQIPYKEIPLLVEDPRGYKMSFEEKALYLTEEFSRRPNMVGFKLELHNISGPGGTVTEGKPASLSLSVYETEEDLGDTFIPVKIHVTYRTSF